MQVKQTPGSVGSVLRRELPLRRMGFAFTGTRRALSEDGYSLLPAPLAQGLRAGGPKAGSCVLQGRRKVGAGCRLGGRLRELRRAPLSALPRIPSHFPLLFLSVSFPHHCSCLPMQTFSRNTILVPTDERIGISCPGNPPSFVITFF